MASRLSKERKGTAMRPHSLQPVQGRHVQKELVEPPYVNTVAKNYPYNPDGLHHIRVSQSQEPPSLFAAGTKILSLLRKMCPQKTVKAIMDKWQHDHSSFGNMAHFFNDLDIERLTATNSKKQIIAEQNLQAFYDRVIGSASVFAEFSTEEKHEIYEKLKLSFKCCYKGSEFAYIMPSCVYEDIEKIDDAISVTFGNMNKAKYLYLYDKQAFWSKTTYIFAHCNRSELITNLFIESIQYEVETQQQQLEMSSFMQDLSEYRFMALVAFNNAKKWDIEKAREEFMPKLGEWMNLPNIEVDLQNIALQRVFETVFHRDGLSSKQEMYRCFIDNKEQFVDKLKDVIATIDTSYVIDDIDAATGIGLLVMTFMQNDTIFHVPRQITKKGEYVQETAFSKYQRYLEFMRPLKRIKDKHWKKQPR
jgi:hypothetical protein